MAEQEIDFEFEVGVKKLVPFLELLKAQMKAQGLSPQPYDEDEVQDQYVGYKFQHGSDKCSLGIWFSNPTVLHFGLAYSEHRQQPPSNAWIREWKRGESGWIASDIDLIDAGFFDTDTPVPQADIIADFIAECLRDIDR